MKSPEKDALTLCRVKFGAFYEFLEAEHGAKFDRIASGHYARIVRDPQNRSAPVQLALTPDPVKDQTYFLAHLSQQQLSRTIFPLGPLTKVGKVLPVSALLRQSCVSGWLSAITLVQQTQPLQRSFLQTQTNAVVCQM